MNKPELDVWRFDALANVPTMLWGSKPIARVLGVSEATIRRWANEPGIPIYKPAGTGRYFARLHELESWLQRKNRPDVKR